MIHYYTRPNGVAEVEGDSFVLPEDWEEITAAEYDAALAAIDADRLARQEAAALTECEAKKAVYQDMKSASHLMGWSEATCQALSGYAPGDC